MWRGVFQK
ncbi:hypothetical protein TIFTF001_056466 [Ficus carica]|uniref:Uncharacterized protein n=1 Tax=Ficus carica TaxID=3494 RepID=A0AA88EJ99_FICCA|nr:hypothetical protein TIFTF001_056466 [Ficus carica]